MHPGVGASGKAASTDVAFDRVKSRNRPHLYDGAEKIFCRQAGAVLKLKQCQPLLAHPVNEPETYIEGSERLTGIFGCWPSFHDAEVIEFHLWRGDVEPEQERYVFPVLTTKIHLWELTHELDASGFLVTRNHTLATLRFHDVENLRMEGFNHQNAIFGLRITTEERGGGLPPYHCVEFEPAHGVAATFRCFRIEVLHAERLSDSNHNG